MIEKLMKLAENSYSPYSHFRVATIVVMKDGQEFVGVNVENSAYGSTICSERSAILSAISNGYTKGDFKEVNVMVSSGEIGAPCFVCRQMISELFEEDCIIRCYSTKGDYKEYTVKELCPYPFGEDDLK